MTPRERVKAVYQGKTPDRVPLMLDLSHWYKKNYNIFFDLTGFKTVEHDLVALHKKVGAISYLEMGSFYEVYYNDDSIDVRQWTDEQGVFHTEIVTPLGRLTEERVFEPISYSYNIRKRLLENVADFPIVIYLMDRCQCRERFSLCREWQQALGELAFPYCNLPYSGLGYLISRNLGVEKTCLAIYDHPQEVAELVGCINACNLRMLDTLLSGPFEVIIQSDNFDSQVQTTKFFNTYSREYYTELANRVHAAGKYFAVHVDGEMRGCLSNMAECGVDCIDAATPAPMFALTPQQAREQAGPDMILSGGIPATVFGNMGTDQEFVNAVKCWLDTRDQSPRLILAAGDQVPSDAPVHRIEMLAELVDKYGCY